MEKILNYRFSTSFTLKGLLQASVGGVLEFYDFMVFIMLAKYISISFFDGSDYFKIMATYFVMAIGYISKPLGGIVLSHFGDKVGRKPIFILSIIIMALFTLLIAFIPTYAQIGIYAPILLLVARVIQGLALGGELPGAITFVYEHMPRNKKMTGMAILLCGVYFGVFLGTFIPYLLTIFYTNQEFIQYAWRIPFVIGGILGGVALYFRKDMKETPIFAHIKVQRNFFSVPLKELIKSYKMELMCTLILTFSFESMLVFFYGLLPSFLSVNMNYSYQEAFKLSSIINIIAVCAYLVLGFLLLRYTFKKRPFLVAVYILSAILSMVFLAALPSFNLLYILLTALFLVFILSIGNIIYKTILPEMYEARCRFSGTSLSFNIGNGLAGGLTPLVVTWLIHMYHATIVPAYYLCVTSIVGIVIVGLLGVAQRRRQKKLFQEDSRVRVRDVKEIMDKNQKELFEWGKGKDLSWVREPTKEELANMRAEREARLSQWNKKEK